LEDLVKILENFLGIWQISGKNRQISDGKWANFTTKPRFFPEIGGTPGQNPRSSREIWGILRKNRQISGRIHPFFVEKRQT
jgi:hypothetical protein